MTAAQNIVLIGCGNMGSGLMRGWQNAKIEAHFSIIEPGDIPFENIDHFKTPEDAKDALNEADFIVLAVKPQTMPELCPKVAKHLNDDAAVLSIAAGQSVEIFENYFGKTRPIIRTMPNTPAAIGKGMSVALANEHTKTAQKALTALLLGTAGRLEWLEDESLIDAVTALSGSGPAYVFLLIETLAEAGQKIGLSERLSKVLARQTIIGAAALAENDSASPPAKLRENVTSPGGTTEAALKILMDGEMQDIFDRALIAARDRSKELGQ